MRNRIYVSVIALAFAVAGSAFGAAAAHSGGAPLCESVFGGTIGTGTGGAGATNAGFDFGGGSWGFGVNAAYHHLFFDPIQLGGKLNVGFANNGTTTTHAIGLLVGPTFNFMNTTPGDISDAVFLFVGAGLSMAKVTTSTTDFQFGAEVGKRFKVWDNISYRPSFGFTKTGSNSIAFTVNLLNISLLY